MNKKVMQKIVSIEKQEQSAEKVELALDDYKRLRRELFKVDEQLRGTVSEYASLKKKIIDIRTKATRLSMAASKILQEGEKIAVDDLRKAKELGVDSNVVNQEYRPLQNEVSEIERIAERVIQATKNIK